MTDSSSERSAHPWGDPALPGHSAKLGEPGVDSDNLVFSLAQCTCWLIKVSVGCTAFRNPRSELVCHDPVFPKDGPCLTGRQWRAGFWRVSFSHLWRELGPSMPGSPQGCSNRPVLLCHLSFQGLPFTLWISSKSPFSLTHIFLTVQPEVSLTRDAPGHVIVPRELHY